MAVRRVVCLECQRRGGPLDVEVYIYVADRNGDVVDRDGSNSADPIELDRYQKYYAIADGKATPLYLFRRHEHVPERVREWPDPSTIPPPGPTDLFGNPIRRWEDPPEPDLPPKPCTSDSVEAGSGTGGRTERDGTSRT